MDTIAQIPATIKKRKLLNRLAFWKPVKTEKPIVDKPIQTFNVWQYMTFGATEPKSVTFKWSGKRVDLQAVLRDDDAFASSNRTFCSRAPYDLTDSDSSDIVEPHHSHRHCPVVDWSIVTHKIDAFAKAHGYAAKMDIVDNAKHQMVCIRMPRMNPCSDHLEIGCIRIVDFGDGQRILFASSHFDNLSTIRGFRLDNDLKTLIKEWKVILKPMLPFYGASTTTPLTTIQKMQFNRPPRWICAAYGQSFNKVCVLERTNVDGCTIRHNDASTLKVIKKFMLMHQKAEWSAAKKDIKRLQNAMRAIPKLKQYSRINGYRPNTLGVAHFTTLPGFVAYTPIYSYESILLWDSGSYCVYMPRQWSAHIYDEDQKLVAKLSSTTAPGMACCFFMPIGSGNLQDLDRHIMGDNNVVLWRCTQLPAMEGTTVPLDSASVGELLVSVGLAEKYCAVAKAIDEGSLPMAALPKVINHQFRTTLRQTLQPKKLVQVVNILDTGTFLIETSHALNVGPLHDIQPSIYLVTDSSIRMCWYFANHIVLLYGKIGISGKMSIVLCTFSFAPASSTATTWFERDLIVFSHAHSGNRVDRNRVVQKVYQFVPGSRLQQESFIVDRDSHVDQSTTLPVITQFVVANHYKKDEEYEALETFVLLVDDDDESEHLNVSRATRNAGLRLWLGNVTKISGTTFAPKKNVDLATRQSVLATASQSKWGKLRETGFFAYKACLTEDGTRPCIATLFVPPTAAVSNWESSDPKKRFSDVLVLAIDQVPVLSDGTLDGSFRPPIPKALAIVEAALDPANERNLPGVNYNIMCTVCGKLQDSLERGDTLWVQHYPCEHVACMACHTLCMKSLKSFSSLVSCPVCHVDVSKCNYIPQREIGDCDFLIDWTPAAAELKRARSIHNPSFIYTVGQSIHIANFDFDLRRVCSAGVHAFVADMDGTCFQHVIQYGATNTNMRVTQAKAVPAASSSSAPASAAQKQPNKDSKSLKMTSFVPVTSTKTSQKVESAVENQEAVKVPTMKSSRVATTSFDASTMVVANAASSSHPIDEVQTSEDEELESLQPIKVVREAFDIATVATPSSSNVGRALWNQRDQNLGEVRSIYPTLDYWTSQAPSMTSELVSMAMTITLGDETLQSTASCGAIPGYSQYYETKSEPQVAQDLAIPNLVTQTFGSLPELRPLLKASSADLIQWSPDPRVIDPKSIAPLPISTATPQVAPSAVQKDAFAASFPSVPLKPVSIPLPHAQQEAPPRQAATMVPQ